MKRENVNQLFNTVEEKFSFGTGDTKRYACKRAENIVRKFGFGDRAMKACECAYKRLKLPRIVSNEKDFYKLEALYINGIASKEQCITILKRTIKR